MGKGGWDMGMLWHGDAGTWECWDMGMLGDGETRTLVGGEGGGGAWGVETW